MSRAVSGRIRARFKEIKYSFKFTRKSNDLETGRCSKLLFLSFRQQRRRRLQKLVWAWAQLASPFLSKNNDKNLLNIQGLFILVVIYSRMAINYRITKFMIKVWL